MALPKKLAEIFTPVEDGWSDAVYRAVDTQGRGYAVVRLRSGFPPYPQRGWRADPVDGRPSRYAPDLSELARKLGYDV